MNPSEVDPEVSVEGGSGAVRVDGLRLLRLDASAARPVEPETPVGGVFYRALGNSGLTATVSACVTHSGPSGPSVTVTTPPPKPGNGVVLLVHDPTGATSWHKPDVQPPTAREFLAKAGLTATPSEATTAPDTSPAATTFTIDSARFVVPAQAEGFFQHLAEELHHFWFHPDVLGAKQLLTTLEFPLEHLVGWTVDKWFTTWENNKHPTVVRWYPPDTDHTVGEPLSPTNWHLLAQGPTLLFIHGIFSSCESGFSSLAGDAATMDALHARYEGRIIGFDHPTATKTPAENAAALLAQIPDGVDIDIDIVTHSRGGLVARELAANGAAKLKIRRIIFAATPNGGSEIVDTQNFARLVGRITSLLTLPAGALVGPAAEITEILAGLLELVKIIGIGAAVGLSGLESMLPNGPYLPELVARETAAYGTAQPPNAYAAAASFVPGPLLATAFHKLDDLGNLVDEAVFPGVPNDIAVPTAGVWDPAATGGSAPTADSLFPVANAQRLEIPEGDTCWHCSYFSQDEMRAAVVNWLTG